MHNENGRVGIAVDTLNELQAKQAEREQTRILTKAARKLQAAAKIFHVRKRLHHERGDGEAIQ